MRSVAISVLCFSAAMVAGAGQDNPPAAVPDDPRVGLKAGFRDAGEAVQNMELVATVPKPEGFFDPMSPEGVPTPPEKEPEEEQEKEKEKEEGKEGEPEEKKEEKEDPSPAEEAKRASFLAFANTDLAFSGDRLFVGNFHGFNTYSIEDPTTPKHLVSVVCPGGQGDVSVLGNLLFMSVEQTRGRLDCGVQGVMEPVSAERFRGIRIFDISDVRMPKQVAAVQTCRGSHTHTLVTDPDDEGNVYLYGSGTSSVRSGEELADCSGLKPDEDPNTALFSIDVIQVPVASPEKARVVNRPRIFADATTGTLSGLWRGGDHGPGTQKTSETNQCHDITVFPEMGLAAGACSGNGILLDISDPANPVRLDHVADQNFAYWHSATFNHDGSKVIFTDEWGGGTRPRCRETDLPEWGADAIFDIVDGKMHFRGYYKPRAPQGELENCVAHNGSIIPVPGRDIMVQGWYQGGISVFDFTDSANPVEIAFFDRGPINGTQLVTAGHWSAYWNNGLIYGSEIARGVDVLKLTPSEYLSQNEIDAASLIQISELNTQRQQRIEWPASSVVARAYVDQLQRTKGIQPERAFAVMAALDRTDQLQNGRESGAAATMPDELEALAAQLERDSDAASGLAAVRLQALAAAMKGITARLR
ncbi:MAG: LVIVD repeat-containing protein [Vicinamibacteria bacterium]